MTVYWEALHWTRSETNLQVRRDYLGRERGKVWRMGSPRWRYTGLPWDEPGVITVKEAQSLCQDPLKAQN